MFTVVPRRTLVLVAVTAATGLAASGCGSGHGGGHGASVTTSTSPTASENAADRAFVAQMVPHHEMAVEMAAEAPKLGLHDEIKRLGTSISTSQRTEIGQLRAVAKQLGVTPAAAPGGGMDHGSAHGGSSMATDAEALGLSEDAMGMSMDMAALRTARPFDRAFIDEMVPHHQGAIRMARAELERGRNPKLKQIALSIVADQQDEIRRMNAWRKAWYGAASPAGGVPPAT